MNAKNNNQSGIQLTEIDHYFVLLQHEDIKIDWKLK
jgi:hypothetical protein